MCKACSVLLKDAGLRLANAFSPAQLLKFDPGSSAFTSSPTFMKLSQFDRLHWSNFEECVDNFEGNAIKSIKIEKNKNQEAKLHIEYFADKSLLPEDRVEKFLDDALNDSNIELLKGKVEAILEDAHMREISVVHPINVLICSEINSLFRICKHPVKVHYSHLKNEVGSCANFEADFAFIWPGKMPRYLWEMKTNGNLSKLRQVKRVCDITDTTQSAMALARKGDNTDSDSALHWPLRQIFTNMVINGSNIGTLDGIDDKYAFVRTQQREIISSPLFTLKPDESHTANFFQAQMLLVAISEYYDLYEPESIEMEVVKGKKGKKKVSGAADDSKQDDTSGQMRSESSKSGSGKGKGKGKGKGNTKQKTTLAIDGLKSVKEGKGAIGALFGTLTRDGQVLPCVTKEFNVTNKEMKYYYENEMYAYELLEQEHDCVFNCIGNYRYADDGESGESRELLVIERDDKYITLQQYFEEFVNKNKNKSVEEAKSELNILKSKVCSKYKIIHSKGVMQNDVKTANILISSENESVKLIDFSHARFECTQGEYDTELNNVKDCLDEAVEQTLDDLEKLG